MNFVTVVNHKVRTNVKHEFKTISSGPLVPHEIGILSSGALIANIIKINLFILFFWIIPKCGHLHTLYHRYIYIHSRGIVVGEFNKSLRNLHLLWKRSKTPTETEYQNLLWGHLKGRSCEPSKFTVFRLGLHTLFHRPNGAYHQGTVGRWPKQYHWYTGVWILLRKRNEDLKLRIENREY